MTLRLNLVCKCLALEDVLAASACSRADLIRFAHERRTVFRCKQFWKWMTETLTTKPQALTIDYATDTTQHIMQYRNTIWRPAETAPTTQTTTYAPPH